MLCQGLGILQDGEEASAAALLELERRFEGQIPDDVLEDLKIMFCIDSQEAEEVENALIGHSGAAALDQVEVGTDDQDVA
jgi:hypothetical protein